MKRKEYNKNVLERCMRLLQSHDSNEIYEGVVLSTYLIEQAFKAELRKVNPLLYFDQKNISDKRIIGIALNKITKEEIRRLRTTTAKKCVTQMCEYRKEFEPHRANIEELFEIRNYVLHSIDDLFTSDNLAAETAVSALRACRKYVIKHSGISSTDFNPLTSREFEELQEEKRNRRNDDLKEELKEHKNIFEKLSQLEVSRRITAKIPETEDCTWVEETIECPACGQISFDKIGAVDFDWNPDGILSSGEYHYQCRVCKLDLSEYEYEIVSDF